MDYKWTNHPRQYQAEHSKPNFQGPVWMLNIYGDKVPRLYRVLVARRDGFYYGTAEIGMGTDNMEWHKLEGVTRRNEAKAVALILTRME